MSNSNERINSFVVVLLVVFISAVFLSMIRSFLMAIFLAGIFAALTRPIYHWLEKVLKGRRSLASVLTLTLIIIVVVVPLGVLTGVVTGQAIKVSQSAVPWVKTQLSQPGGINHFLEDIPYYDKIAPHSELILRKGRRTGGRHQPASGQQPLVGCRRRRQSDFHAFRMALHHVFLFDGRRETAGEDPLLPALTGPGGAAAAGAVHLGEPGDIERHRGHRHSPGRSGRSGFLGGRHSQRHFLGE